MEARRKIEEEQRKKQEEEDMKTAAVIQLQLEKEALENTRYREQLEQEKRDHELALRLASETNEQVDDISPPTNRRYCVNLYVNWITVIFQCKLQWWAGCKSNVCW